MWVDWVARLKHSLTGSLGNKTACLRSPGRSSGKENMNLCNLLYTHWLNEKIEMSNFYYLCGDGIIYY
jgi:hypothetical protein